MTTNTNTIPSETVEFQLAVALRLQERMAQSDSFDLRGAAMDFRECLEADAIAFVDSEAVTNQVEEAFALVDQLTDVQSVLQDLFSQFFDEDVDDEFTDDDDEPISFVLNDNFDRGFGEGRGFGAIPLPAAPDARPLSGVNDLLSRLGVR